MQPGFFSPPPEWESPQACVTSIFFKSADLLCKQKGLQESKDRLKDLPILEILPTTPYKCILQPSSKLKRNIFLEVLAADSCKWDYLHSRMQTNLITWGGHMDSCLLLSGMSNFLFNAFIPFWQCTHFYNIILKVTLISFSLYKTKRI